MSNPPPFVIVFPFCCQLEELEDVKIEIVPKTFKDICFKLSQTSSQVMDSNCIESEFRGYEIVLDENNDVVHVTARPSHDSSALPALPVPAVSTVSSRLKPKIDSDPDTPHRLHFIKFGKRQGRTFKLWECGLCGQDFRHQSYLIRHLPIHTGEKRFSCPMCEKSFSHSSSWIQHKATHSDHRPYACDVCLKTFARASTLVAHQKTHISDKQFKCDQCDMSFHQKINLQHHLYAHSGEKPYHCEDCDKSFTQLSNLKSHQRSHHAISKVKNATRI